MLGACARESKPLIGRFLKEKLMSDHVLFSSHEGQQGAANGQDSWGLFQGCTRLWTAGCWLAVIVLAGVFLKRNIYVW